MLLNGTPLPVVLEIGFGRNSRLGGKIGNHDSRYFILECREAGLFLKEFEQESKSESDCPCFIAKQGQFFDVQSPILNQLFGFPLSLHLNIRGKCRESVESVLFVYA
jgi:hypothetical protein